MAFLSFYSSGFDIRHGLAKTVGLEIENAVVSYEDSRKNFCFRIPDNRSASTQRSVLIKTKSEALVKIVTNSLLFKLPLLRRYSAIVIGRRCFIKDATYSERLLRHEWIHQEQMDRVGVMRFYIIYLKDYFFNLCRYRNHDEAYSAIPFEREAYARENETGDLLLKSNRNR
ncbi:MAG: hypothetical protein EOP04_20490 [Proteobacteria bacterium]|nr:MAG: hypothetical protein EOP04_20490 [Pseudomonadota bacterium]